MLRFFVILLLVFALVAWLTSRLMGFLIRLTGAQGPRGPEPGPTTSYQPSGGGLRREKDISDRARIIQKKPADDR